jgi:hypothetical protein
MSRVHSQALQSSLILCATLAACEGPHPGLLGELGSAIAAKHAASPDAAVPDTADASDGSDGPSAPDASTPTGTPTAGGASTPPPTVPSTPPPTAPTVDPAPSQFDREPDYVVLGDDYIEPVETSSEYFFCLGTDLTFAEDVFVTALELVPQHAEYVFGARVSFSPDGVCDALGITAAQVFDYRPNNRRIEFPGGDALRLPARNRITIQMHLSPKQAASTDTKLTALKLWTLPLGERAQREVVRVPFHAFDIDIPVGAVDHEVTATTLVDKMYIKPGAEIIGVAPEMHQLGQQLRASLIAADGTRTTLLDLQDWSLDERKDQLFDPSKYIPVKNNALIEQTCVYSNRPEDQALDSNGDPLPAQRTVFGEDTRAETCRVNVYLRYPL